jgi:hypothetical protein
MLFWSENIKLLSGYALTGITVASVLTHALPAYFLSGSDSVSTQSMRSSNPMRVVPAAAVHIPNTQIHADLVATPMAPETELYGAALAEKMNEEDASNPFSMNYDPPDEPALTLPTIDYERACLLADELGEVQQSIREETGELSRCEKTVARPLTNERIEVEVMAVHGNTENIAATVWINEDMTARQALLTYEEVFQYLAYQFSRDTLSDDIYRLESRSPVHFKSEGGQFFGLLSYSYAHLQFSYSR